MTRNFAVELQVVGVDNFGSPQAHQFGAHGAEVFGIDLGDGKLARGDVGVGDARLVVMGDDYTWDQAMLAASVADVLGLDRPDWM